MVKIARITTFNARQYKSTALAFQAAIRINFTTLLKVEAPLTCKTIIGVNFEDIILIV